MEPVESPNTSDIYELHEVDTTKVLQDHNASSPYKVSATIYKISAVLIIVLIVCSGFLYYVFRRLNDDDNKVVHTLDVTQKMEKMINCPDDKSKNEFDSLMKKLCVAETREENCAIQDLKNGSLKKLSDAADKILSTCVDSLPKEKAVIQTR